MSNNPSKNTFNHLDNQSEHGGEPKWNLQTKHHHLYRHNPPIFTSTLHVFSFHYTIKHQVVMHHHHHGNNHDKALGQQHHSGHQCYHKIPTRIYQEVR